MIPTLVTTYAAPQVKEMANENAFTRADFRVSNLMITFHLNSLEP